MTSSTSSSSGSGASGGTLASHLARRGVRVAIVEGGPRVNTRTDFNTHAMPFDFPNRQIPTMRPGKVGFDSERSRGVGGKTMLWNAVALRLSQRDFKGRTFEGAGEDWPIDYKDIAPYYDAIEREVGVCGNLDGLEDLPDGVFLPPVPLKCSDEIMRRAARSLGANVIHVRKATLTVAEQDAAWPVTSAATAWPDAMWSRSTTRRMSTSPRPKRADTSTVFSDCIVREVLVSDENRATGVRYLHRVHQRRGRGSRPHRGRGVRLCPEHRAAPDVHVAPIPDWPGELERPARAALHPPLHGRGSSASSRACGASAVTNDEGFLDHAYLPVVHAHQQDARLCPQFRRAAQLPEQAVRGMGEDRRRLRPRLQGVGEGRLSGVRAVHAVRRDAPNAQSYVDLDRERTDKFGLPQARRYVRWGENEEALFNDMVRWSLAMLEKAGAEMLTRAGQARHRTTSWAAAGWAVTRGHRSSTADCRTHDVPNLYVVDGSVFPSASEKNPTHTIMALAARAGEHIAERMRRGDL